MFSLFLSDWEQKFRLQCIVLQVPKTGIFGQSFSPFVWEKRNSIKCHPWHTLSQFIWSAARELLISVIVFFRFTIFIWCLGIPSVSLLRFSILSLISGVFTSSLWQFCHLGIDVIDFSLWIKMFSWFFTCWVILDFSLGFCICMPQLNSKKMSFVCFLLFSRAWPGSSQVASSGLPSVNSGSTASFVFKTVVTFGSGPSVCYPVSSLRFGW